MHRQFKSMTIIIGFKVACSIWRIKQLKQQIEELFHVLRENPDKNLRKGTRMIIFYFYLLFI